MTTCADPRFPFEVIDLTHTILPGMPVWPGDPATERRTAATRIKEGYSLFEWKFGEHTGTHVGAPSHFIQDAGTVDSIAAPRLIMPLVLVDMAKEKRQIKGYAATIADVEANEAEFGKISPCSLVCLVTGWEKKWPVPAKVFRWDDHGCLTHPGFSGEAATWLLKERKASGLGTDAPGIDPGPDPEFKACKATAEAGTVHVENLAHLDRVPSRGAWVILGMLPFQGGSGSPARVLALIPKS